MGRWIRRVAVGLLALLALVTYVLWPRSIRTERHVVKTSTGAETGAE